MSQTTFTIWTNASFDHAMTERLELGVVPHRLVYASEMNKLNLAASPIDPLLAEADIAFGQPDAGQVVKLANLKWVHLSSAGYTAYDRDEVKAAMKARGAALTNSSNVYDEPCAQHTMAMMLAMARQLPVSMRTQLDDRGWPAAKRRDESFLLNGQTALIFGFGAIANRLSELLAPFKMNLIGVRRKATGNEPIRIISESQSSEFLPLADHVINILPANDSTNRYFDARKFNMTKPGALFYNIGRGVTVDQEALLAALQSGRLGAAYLDVTDPEPLPADHPLWTAPNCFITPHTAGGHNREMECLIDHFLENLKRFSAGEKLKNRIV